MYALNWRYRLLTNLFLRLTFAKYFSKLECMLLSITLCGCMCVKLEAIP